MDALPSLRALQAFDAAARNGSFAVAARELSVSPAAISQLVRTLEDQVGRKLFHRLNRRVVLTEAGREVLPRLATAFDELRSVSRELSGSDIRPTLVVSVPPSLLMGWLSMRIATFLALHGAVDIALRGEEDPVPFERERIDIRLSYGSAHYREHETLAIASDAVLPLCSPGFLDRHGPFADAGKLLATPLIHTDWGPTAAQYPTWWNWAKAQGLSAGRELRHGLTVNSSRAALEAAASGVGMVLGQGIYAAEPVKESRLVVALNRPLGLSQPYCLTVPSQSARKPVVSWFRDWFVGECTGAVDAFAAGERPVAHDSG
jgi:LysR family transcriptional regulator, glycine cleavage system transcriptional activator